MLVTVAGSRAGAWDFPAGQTIIGADRHLNASLRPLVASLQAHEALMHQTDTLLQALDVMLQA